MSNDSSTGGYVVPISTTGDLEDQSLNRFLHDLVAGITALDPTLVRPRWQPEPPALPEPTVDWASIGEVNRDKDVFSFVGHQSGGDGNDYTYRNQILNILCTFYGPNARMFSERLSMGFEIAQNREVMTLNGYGLVEVGSSTTTTEMINQRWLPREDVPFSLRRAQEFKYPILNLLGGQGTLVDDTVVRLNFTSQKPKSPFPLFAWGLFDGSTFAGWGQGNWK